MLSYTCVTKACIRWSIELFINGDLNCSQWAHFLFLKPISTLSTFSKKENSKIYADFTNKLSFIFSSTRTYALWNPRIQ